jgi:hypothetical protein
VTVTVTDDDGGSHSDEAVVTVKDQRSLRDKLKERLRKLLEKLRKYLHKRWQRRH